MIHNHWQRRRRLNMTSIQWYITYKQVVGVEMSKVVPVPGPEFFLPGPGPKFFLTRTSTKIFSEQDKDQNVFFGPRPWAKYFWLGPSPKICFWRDRDQDLKLFSAGPGPKFFSRRDRGQDENFFLTGTGTKTGAKNDWPRSCLASSAFQSCLYHCEHIFVHVSIQSRIEEGV